MYALLLKESKRISPEQVFILSSFVVNAGNYVYNLLLGRVLGPKAFADAAILITLLLVVSFIAMTFQLVVAKFTVAFDETYKEQLKNWVLKRALSVGLVIGALTIGFSPELQQFFNTSSSSMFVFFGCGIPVYFVMSVHRGSLQGTSDFVALSGTYQFEMWARLILTFLLLFIIGLTAIESVSIAIALSFIAGLFPKKKRTENLLTAPILSKTQKKQIRAFFIVTVCYECTQIICNNSDILLVKHFFEVHEAGLYASLALIGRVVYFITWMFVMLLLPKVISKQKLGENTTHIVLQYVGYISALSLTITGLAFLFPETAVLLLFGEAYISIAPFLGWYALATSLFAVSNIFAYYFLSLDTYLPILFSGIMGFAQIGLIYAFHNTLFDVVMMQIIAMALLLIVQIGYFLKEIKRTKNQ